MMQEKRIKIITNTFSRSLQGVMSPKPTVTEKTTAKYRELIYLDNIYIILSVNLVFLLPS